MRSLVLCLSLIAMPAAADIRVDFIEGAPKDRFEIANTATCALGAVEVVIDLSGSAGALVFDTEEAGQGVEVFQPFALVDGADLGLLLGDWGGTGAGDLNGDGTIDGADLGLLLGAWG